MVEGSVHNEQKVAPRLVDAPYEQVEEVFSGFVVPEERGGYRVSTTRERSFSEEQRPYITTVNALLRKRILGEVEGDALSLSERMAKHFKEQEGKPSFRQAMSDSLFSIVEEAGIAQPNLTPALDALLALGGAQGLQSTVNMSATRLSNAVYAKKMDVGLVQTPDAIFINPHFTKDTKYDVQCASPVVAKTIIEEAERAAIRLASENNLKGRYEEPAQKSGQDSFPERILQLGTELHEKARETYKEEATA